MRFNTEHNELSHARPSDVPNFIQSIPTAARINTIDMPSWQRTYNCWVGKVQPFPNLGAPGNTQSVVSGSARLSVDDFRSQGKIAQALAGGGEWSANPQIMRSGQHAYTDVQYPGGKSAFWGTVHRPFSNNDLIRVDYQA